MPKPLHAEDTLPSLICITFKQQLKWKIKMAAETLQPPSLFAYDLINFSSIVLPLVISYLHFVNRISLP